MKFYFIINWNHVISSLSKKKKNPYLKSLYYILDDLFDIAHNNAFNLINIEEDKLFLLAQREKGRRGYMAKRDIHFDKIEENVYKKMKYWIEENVRKVKENLNHHIKYN